jgi:hypothetical protein
LKALLYYGASPDHSLHNMKSSIRWQLFPILQVQSNIDEAIQGIRT